MVLSRRGIDGRACRPYTSRDPSPSKDGDVSFAGVRRAAAKVGRVRGARLVRVGLYNMSACTPRTFLDQEHRFTWCCSVQKGLAGSLQE
jgi:hypothetical protein